MVIPVSAKATDNAQMSNSLNEMVPLVDDPEAAAPSSHPRKPDDDNSRETAARPGVGDDETPGRGDWSGMLSRHVPDKTPTRDECMLRQDFMARGLFVGTSFGLLLALLIVFVVIVATTIARIEKHKGDPVLSCWVAGAAVVEARAATGDRETVGFVVRYAVRIIPTGPSTTLNAVSWGELRRTKAEAAADVDDTARRHGDAVYACSVVHKATNGTVVKEYTKPAEPPIMVVMATIVLFFVVLALGLAMGVFVNTTDLAMYGY